MTDQLSDDLDGLLGHLWALGGTDLLLTSGAAPLARVDGLLRSVPERAALTGADTASMAEAVLPPALHEVFRSGRDVDFSLDWRGRARVRGNAYRQRGAATLALRMIPREIPGFDALGVPAAARALAQLRQGLVLVTGPTGSGKSTTLASMVDWINHNRPVHVLTIEDPVEYVHDHRLAAISQREVGSDTESFAQALRAALREDPDVILVGEIRDLESIRSALTLAETGHLVLATLHTNDTAQAVDRLVDVFPAEHQPQIRVQLANTLAGIVHQRLLPRIGGGMAAAFEVLLPTPPVRNLVREGKSGQLRNQLVMGRREGMQTLEDSLNALVRAGWVTFEEATARAVQPGDLEHPGLAALPPAARSAPF